MLTSFHILLFLIGTFITSLLPKTLVISIGVFRVGGHKKSALINLWSEPLLILLAPYFQQFHSFNLNMDEIAPSP